MKTNYITRMQEENKALEAKIAAIEKELFSFGALLHSPKFTGTDCDGERKDWIATGDVLNWLREVRSQLV